MSDQSSQDTSAFYGQASWSPTSTWNLQSNAVTQLSRSNFKSTSSSDTEGSTATGNAIMQSDGILRCPYPSSFILNVGISLSDFCDITLPDDQVPNMVFQFQYVPASSNSPSPQSFVMGTISVNKQNSYAQVAQRAVMTTGDYIKILVTSTLPINNYSVESQSQFLYMDDASNLLVQLYAGVTGQPPAYNVTNKVSYMCTAPITQGKAIFTLTQDGMNGQSLFSSGISFFTVSVQSITPITSITQILDHSWDPIPTNLKTATVHFRTNVGEVDDNKYVAVARFDGW